MTRDEARSMVAALARGRARWLAETVAALQAEGVWLVGSLGSGRCDEWSDVDIIVVGGEWLLDETLLTLEMPDNGPAGGGYVGAMYDVGLLPLWVDWYRWPSGAPIPRESRLLAGTGTAGSLDLSETLELVGRGLPGPAPDPNAFALCHAAFGGEAHRSRRLGQGRGDGIDAKCALRRRSRRRAVRRTLAG